MLGQKVGLRTLTRQNLGSGAEVSVGREAEPCSSQAERAQGGLLSQVFCRKEVDWQDGEVVRSVKVAVRNMLGRK